MDQSKTTISEIRSELSRLSGLLQAVHDGGDPGEIKAIEEVLGPTLLAIKQSLANLYLEAVDRKRMHFR